MMNKTVNLSDKSAVYLRKTIGFASLGTSFLILVAIVLGVVPIFDRNSNLITIIFNLIEITKITSKPLLYCLSRVVFSVGYIIVLVLSTIKSIEQIKTVRLWKNDTHDTKTGRYALSKCVILQNEIFINFIILVVLSYLIDSYKLSFIANLVLLMFVTLTFAINYMRNILVKRHVLESVFSSLITTLLSVITMLFVFNSLDVDLDMLIRQSLNFIRSIFTLVGKIPFSYLLKVFVTQIFVPVFSIYVLVQYILLLTSSISFGMRFISFEKSCKRFMIVNLIAFGVIVNLQVLSEGVYKPEVVLNCILNNLEFVFLGIATFLISKNQGSKTPDAPTYEDTIQETNE